MDQQEKAKTGTMNTKLSSDSSRKTKAGLDEQSCNEQEKQGRHWDYAEDEEFTKTDNQQKKYIL